MGDFLIQECIPKDEECMYYHNQQFKVSAIRLIPPDKGNKGRPVFVEETAKRIPQSVVKRIMLARTLPRPPVYLVPKVQYRVK